jgi:hypothetical protein
MEFTQKISCKKQNVLANFDVIILDSPYWIISRYQQNEGLTSRRCWHDLRQLNSIYYASTVPREQLLFEPSITLHRTAGQVPAELRI